MFLKIVENGATVSILKIGKDFSINCEVSNELTFDENKVFKGSVHIPWYKLNEELTDVSILTFQNRKIKRKYVYQTKHHDIAERMMDEVLKGLQNLPKNGCLVLDITSEDKRLGSARLYTNGWTREKYLKRLIIRKPTYSEEKGVKDEDS